MQLGMANSAWEVLEDLPTELKNHPRVLLGRIDVLLHLKEWAKAHQLGESVTSLWPENWETWYRLACSAAQLGMLDLARDAVKSCTRLHLQTRARIMEEPLLEPIWMLAPLR